MAIYKMITHWAERFDDDLRSLMDRYSDTTNSGMTEEELKTLRLHMIGQLELVTEQTQEKYN